MKIKDKIIAVASVIFGAAAALFSAVFCIKSKKKIDTLEEEKNERIQETNNTINAITQAYKKEQAENEELKNKAFSGNTLNNDSALNELLYNAAKKGKQRNSKSNL